MAASRRGVRMISRLLILGVLLSIFVWPACTGRGGTNSIKLAHGLDVTHPVHRAMVRMGEIVAEESQGTVRIDIYPSEQLDSGECASSTPEAGPSTPGISP